MQANLSMGCLPRERISRFSAPCASSKRYVPFSFGPLLGDGGAIDRRPLANSFTGTFNRSGTSTDALAAEKVPAHSLPLLWTITASPPIFLRSARGEFSYCPPTNGGGASR
jgi:hypothetical protein